MLLLFSIERVAGWEVCILKSFSGLEVGLWIENFESWKARSFEYLCVEKTSSFGWHFRSKFDRIGWNELAKLTKMETSSIGMFHKENMSSINLFQKKGFSRLAASSPFSRSATKIMEKATAILVPIAMPWVCTKCWSLNLKEFSSIMSCISSRKSLVGIGNFCS